MSEEHKDFGEKASEKAKEFSNEAKESAKEFKESWNETTQGGENKKILSGILAILLGSLGIHKFILGYTKEGVILLLLGILGIFTCGITSAVSWIIGVVEGIIYLTKTDDEFYRTYQIGRKPWF
ncbi:TM2 domain-containing protein [Croceiramulus getboli]|nr:NINE protein [Flavobacteriaceae bacterium YJPT1-3]